MSCVILHFFAVFRSNSGIHFGKEHCAIPNERTNTPLVPPLVLSVIALSKADALCHVFFCPKVLHLTDPWSVGLSQIFQ